MQKRIRTLFMIVALGTVVMVPMRSWAFGFRLGGQFIVDPAAQNLFAFGVQHDLQLVKDYFYFSTDVTFAVNGEYFVIDGAPVGFRFAAPLLGGKLRPGFHVAFLLKDTIRFDPDTANGFGLGASFGPGLAFHFSGGQEIFLDFDIAIYKYVQHNEGLLPREQDAEERQIQLGLMVGFRL